MTETLGSLTLRLSRDLSRLDAERRERLAAIERESQAALRRLPGARAAAERFEAASSEARQACERSIQDAHSAYAAADRWATGARSDDLTSVEHKYVAAGRASDEERRTDLMKAEAAYKARLDEIATSITLDKQLAAREAALETYRKACGAVEASARERLHKNRIMLQSDRDAAIQRERDAVAKAAATRDARIETAQRARDAAIEHARDALMRALESNQDAMSAQNDFEQQRHAAEERYRIGEQRLREEFRARRAAIDETT